VQIAEGRFDRPSGSRRRHDVDDGVDDSIAAVTALLSLDTEVPNLDHEAMAGFSEYERQAEREIATWKTERTGPLGRLASSIASTKAVRWISGHLPHVPSWFSKPIANAVRGFVELLKDGAHWTYRDDQILQRARRLGSRAASVEELAADDMRQLDQLARSFFAENQVLATLEGAGSGRHVAHSGIRLNRVAQPASVASPSRTCERSHSGFRTSRR
jgi:hypothetical protein